MRKIIIVLMLLAGFSLNISAQGWLKKIGKALEQAEKVLDSGNTATRSTERTSSNKEKSRIVSQKTDFTFQEVKEINNGAVGKPVDLGLSIQWSSTNLGAAQAFQMGGYYDYQSNWLGKYWGNDWDIPTLQDWEELLTKCDIIYVEGELKPSAGARSKSIGYFMITGPNGNKIWLPAAGYKFKMDSDYSLDEKLGSEGFYWTSEAISQQKFQGTGGAVGIFIQNTFDTPVPKHYEEDWSLNTALQIRPVYRKRHESVSATSTLSEKFFKGRWESKDGNITLDLDLYDKTVEDMDGGKAYGLLGSVIGVGMDFDNDTFRSVNIDGYTAVVEYDCERSLEGDRGKARLTYNPKTEEITVERLETPKETYCFLPDIILQKKR